MTIDTGPRLGPREASRRFDILFGFLAALALSVLSLYFSF